MKHENEEPTLVFSNEDTGMQEAIKLAQNKFHLFVNELISESKRIVPALEECLIKYAFQADSKDVEIEHMFLTDISFDGEKIIGYLASEPQYISNFKEGDLIIVDQKNVTDWLYILDEVTYGGYTFKYMWKKFSKKEKKLYGNEPPFCWIKGK